jgi:peptide/nickel transport system substrate-binding protein
MSKSYTRLRVKRRLRKRKDQVVDLSQSANRQIERHIFRRWHNLRGAGRFAFVWVGLIAILIIATLIQIKSLGRYYLIPQPVSGGVYTEGIIGTFSNANPIYATSNVDTAVSKLMFGSLFTYDSKNQLVSDLAKSYEVDDRGVIYTVHLRPNLLWHDGEALTSDDVVFTYATIQNPDAKSPLQYNWTGVKVEKVDKLTIRFILPSAYSPFPHSLTSGIIPKHLLKDVPVSQLRSAAFNTKSPIGSGPFALKEIEVSQVSDATQSNTIQFTRFDKYHRGTPKLDGITIKTYSDEDALYKAFRANQVISAAGLNMADQDIETKYETVSLNMTSANMLFLKTTNATLSDVKVRQALIKAVDVPSLTEKVSYPTIPVREPILNGQIGYDSTLQQFIFNRQEAVTLLDAAGWKINAKERFRTKDGKSLILHLAYESNPDFSRIASVLQKQWADVGINLVVDVNQDSSTANYLDSHDYDILLYGINIGADPDVYAYWHSSQADIKNLTHLNLSEYKSSKADLSLEVARARSDTALRAVKYKPFLEAWRNDVPAIGLYQPRYLYITNQHLYGLKDTTQINSPSDRFNNVHNWMINTTQKTRS